MDSRARLDVECLEIAKTAVDRPEMIEGAAAAEIGTVDERDGEGRAAPRRMQSSGHRDAAADDEPSKVGGRESSLSLDHAAALACDCQPGAVNCELSAIAARSHNIVPGVATTEAIRELLGTAHPRSRDHAASCQLARVLRRSRSVPISRSSTTCFRLVDFEGYRGRQSSRSVWRGVILARFAREAHT